MLVHYDRDLEAGVPASFGDEKAGTERADRRDHVNGSRAPLMIPRLIHQTYSTRHVPEEIVANIDHLKTQNPTFEYRFYDDANIADFIRDEYGADVLQSFFKIRPEYGAARADLFRYLLMYAHGGVYLDLKSTTTTPLEQTLRPDDTYLLSHWANRPGEEHESYGTEGIGRTELPEGEFQQWHIICASKSPLLEAVIEQALRNIDRYTPWAMGLGTLGTFTVTGPICYTMAIMPLLSAHHHRRVRTNAELGLRYSIYSDPKGHQKLSRTYYRDRTTPIVMPGSKAAELSFRAYEVAWRLQRKARTLMTGRWIDRQDS